MKVTWAERLPNSMKLHDVILLLGDWRADGSHAYSRRAQRLCFLPPVAGSYRTLGGAGRYTGWGGSTLSPAAPRCSLHSSSPPRPVEPGGGRGSKILILRIKKTRKSSISEMEMSRNQKKKQTFFAVKTFHLPINNKTTQMELSHLF